VQHAVWQAAAVVVASVHLAVVLFLLAGGFLARGRRGLRWAHVAVVTAVVAVAVARLPCPLTELELRLRALGGVEVYRGGFVEHYLVRPLYPAGMTPRVVVLVNAVAVAANLVAYGRLAVVSRRAGVSSA
jgi:hypothetical protein